MNILNELKSDVLDSKSSLSTAFRKGLIIADKLGNKDFKDWIENELNGYTNPDDLPDYRKGTAEVYGDFVCNEGILKNYQIQLGDLSRRIGFNINQKNLLPGVRGLESLLEGNSSPVFIDYWPANLLSTIASSLLQGYVCVSAWWLIPRGRVEQVLDLIRNKLLSFVIELQKQMTDENDENSLSTISQKSATTIIETYIFGNSNIVGSGENINIIAHRIVKKNDLGSLKKFLKEISKIPDKDINDLENAISEDGEIKKPNSFGKKVSKWVGNLAQKLYEGAIKSGIENAPIILAQITDAISKYYRG